MLASRQQKALDCRVKRARRTTLKDVALRAGVSKYAASVALSGRGRVSESTIKKVKAAAKKLSYVKSATLSRIMSEIRFSDKSGKYETIALLYPSRNIMQLRPTFPMIVEGIREEAENLGYSVAEFYLDAPANSSEKLRRIFRARGIRGGVITGLLENNRLPAKYAELWREFKFVAAGLRMLEPELDFSITDQYYISYKSTLNIFDYGFKRPGIVLKKEIDDLIDGRFLGGFLRACYERGNIAEMVPPYTSSELDAPLPDSFAQWIKTNRPDALLCLHSAVRNWLEELGLKIPRDISIAHMERVEKSFTGMDQNNVLVGKNAVRMLNYALNDSNANTRNKAPICSIISPVWKISETLRPKNTLSRR